MYLKIQICVVRVEFFKYLTQICQLFVMTIENFFNLANLYFLCYLPTLFPPHSLPLLLSTMQIKILPIFPFLPFYIIQVNGTYSKSPHILHACFFGFVFTLGD